MPNKRIDQLNPNFDALTGNELIPIFDVNNNSTERITIDTLANFIDVNNDTFITSVDYSNSSNILTLYRNDGLNLTTEIKKFSQNYIPSGETSTILSGYQNIIYGDFVIDGTLNIEEGGELVIINGDLILSGGTLSGTGITYLIDLSNTDRFVTSGIFNPVTKQISFSGNVGFTPFNVDLSSLSTDNFYTTGATLNGNTVEFNRNDISNAYSVDLSPLKFTGNTISECISDIYVTNLNSCSPLHIQPTNNGNVYISESGGNVGIGTTNPQTTLDVNGDVSVSNSISATTFYGDGSNLTGISTSVNYSNVVFVDLVNGNDLTGTINDFTKPFQNIPQAMSAAAALPGISIDNRALVYIRRGNYVSPVINLQNNVDIYCEPGVVFTGSPNIRDNGVAVSANVYGSLKIYTTSGTQPPFNITGPSVITFEFDWISSNAAAIQIFPTTPGGRITIKGNYIYSATIGQGFAITIRNNVNVVMNIANSIESVHQLFRFRFFSGTAVINCPNINLLAGNVYGGNWKQILYIDEVSSTGSIVVNGNMYDKDNTFYPGLAALVRLWTSPAINLTINGDMTSQVNPMLALGGALSKVTYTGKITTTREAIYVDGSTQVNVKNSTIIRTTDTLAGPILVGGSGTLYLNDSTIYSSFTDGNIINIESNNAKLYVKGVIAEGVGFNYFINTGVATPTTGVINAASNKPNSPGFVNTYTIAGSFIVDSAINTPKF
jgi:hypothetical protein